MYKQYRKGECVFLEGETGECAYIIETGSIEIFIRADGRQKLISRLRERAIFGEMSLMDDQVRSATAIAAEDTKLIVISKAYFNEKLVRSEPLVALLAKSLLLRYREMRARLDAMLAPLSMENELMVPGTIHTTEKDAESAVQQVKAENELTQAMFLKQFELVYQPIVSLKDRRIIGCESLIRWRHPERGMIPPLSFIPRAEQNGMIIPLGLWIIEEACRASKRIQEATGLDLGYISVNLSSRQFEPNTLLESIQKIYEATSVDTTKIRYEITESTLMVQPEQTIKVLDRLRAMGSCIAIDDFGTGYSNFAYLHRFPLDTLKIDRSFIAVMHQSPKNHQIVNSLVVLAKSLQMNVVAEGIETEEDHRAIQKIGIDYGQGYLYSRPISEADFCKVLIKTNS